ncbi:RNA polymerase II transcription factor B 52 kDa subunit [Tulasnella sp. JGI-2019a]|nr:RNA polymerase II transcription factor B 52 kDa subunit [Tulasnella sp. JGI-2019a]KAG9015394.1 RNA polymerase II transcription factor B 52 kDa subunit [Tulasnella sp. JGI-2019a]KAG9033356.1 RNA polymerase II transcription factor B 52 kDa subunit [Tulasnella sp. JGI-2019a]
MTNPPTALAHPHGAAQHILLSVLLTQNQVSLARLYSKPSACLALFRLLKPLERQIILNYLWLEGGVSPNIMSDWATKEGRKQFETASQTLRLLHILQANRDGTKQALLPAFQKSFRLALTGGGNHMSFGVPCLRREDRKATVELLDQHASERWESILHFMVSSGTEQRVTKPTKGVLFLLDRSGLMAGQGIPRITSKGFQFLLNSPHEQLWILLMEYLKLSEERNLDLVEVIQFLFMLSTMRLGQDYTTEHLTPTHQAMLEDLQDYGLVYLRKQNPPSIYPTRLATTLTSGTSNLDRNSTSGSGVRQGFIILETNYRLYAYTDNTLQVAILNLFVSLKGRYPDLVTGAITRESVKKALDNGINADQIISYLVTHAHPQMRKNNPLLPITVQDQIRLWEQEKNRVQITEGYLWKEFHGFEDYDLVVDHARALGCLIWANRPSKMFFVTPEGHASCKDLVNKRINTRPTGNVPGTTTSVTSGFGPTLS